MSIEKRFITKEEFDQMKKIYDAKIKDKIGDTYSDYVYLPINDLKEYIALIEKQAQENLTEVKSIKIHFVSQNDDKGQLTTVIEGTFEKENLKAPLMNRWIPCPPICKDGIE